ncbi:testis-expressed basic protein 1 isoform X5 [Panthera tigris]|uniref:testis-expressed basic protein 1 isoform X5 n=1 Tax=Panthera tigris TaxID=9694 RepID=UPI001C6F61AC|nr:testis-expressed basic protein 1 isoform X5 [Panthera tigris]
MAVLEITLAVILTLLGLVILAILLTRWTRRKQNEIDVSRYSSEQSAGLLDYEDGRDFPSQRSKRGRGFRHLYSTESDTSYDDRALSQSSIALVQGSMSNTKAFKATSEPLSGSAGPITGAIGPIMQFTAPIPGGTGPIKLSQKTIVQTPGPIVQYTGPNVETSEMTTTESSLESTPHTNKGAVPPTLTGPPPSVHSGLPLAPIMISQRTSTRPEKSKIIGPVSAVDSSGKITLTPMVKTPESSAHMFLFVSVETISGQTVKTKEPLIKTCSTYSRKYSATTGNIESILKKNAPPTGMTSPSPGKVVKSTAKSAPLLIDGDIRAPKGICPPLQRFQQMSSNKEHKGRAVPLPRTTENISKPASSIRFAEPIGSTPVPTSNWKEDSKSEVKSGTREARNMTPKQDIYLIIQGVPLQNSQSGPKWQQKPGVSSLEKTYEKRQKQKTGVKVEELPKKTQSKEERRETKDKRKDTKKDMNKEKEIDKAQSMEGGDEKYKDEEEERMNMEKKGDEDKEDEDKKGDEDKKKDKDLKEKKYKEEEKNKKNYKKGYEDKIEDKDKEGVEDKTEDRDKKGDEDIEQGENEDKERDGDKIGDMGNNGYEDKIEYRDKRDEDQTEDKYKEGNEDKTEDMGNIGDKDMTEDRDKKGNGDIREGENEDKEEEENKTEDKDEGDEDKTEDIKGDSMKKKDKKKVGKEDKKNIDPKEGYGKKMGSKKKRSH